MQAFANMVQGLIEIFQGVSIIAGVLCAIVVGLMYFARLTKTKKDDEIVKKAMRFLFWLKEGINWVEEQTWMQKKLGGKAWDSAKKAQKAISYAVKVYERNFEDKISIEERTEARGKIDALVNATRFSSAPALPTAPPS